MSDLITKTGRSFGPVTHAQYASDRPTALVSVVKCLRAFTNSPRPLRDGQCLAFMGQKNVFSGVVALVFSNGPSAIFRGVRAVIIDAINGMRFAGLWPHVLNKLRKAVVRVRPTFANGNAARAVSFERFAGGVKTSPKHSSPCVKKWMSCLPATACGRFVPFGGEFVPLTPAGNAYSCSQRRELNVFNRPAIAPAQHVAVLRTLWGFFQNGPKAVFRSNRGGHFLRHTI